MVQKRKKKSQAPFGRQRESFPRPARLCYPWLPSSVSRRGSLGGLWWDPGSQAPARSAGRALYSCPMATGLLREDRTPRAQTRVLHAVSAPHALFPFSASGIGPFSRRADGLEASGAWGNPSSLRPAPREGAGESLASCPGGGLSEFQRKNPSAKSQRLPPLPRPATFLPVA